MEPYEKRRGIYVATAVLLFGGGLLVRNTEWQGNTSLHTLMELAATLLATFVGSMALVRFFSRRDAQFLYIGAGFLGTAMLDGFHTVVTSIYFQPYMPSDNPHLVPWSWIASRLFLSVLLFVSWLLWFRHRNDLSFRPKTKIVMIWSALATIASFLFFSTVHLPTISIEGAIVSRPVELLPAIFFLMALVGYLYKGAWRNDLFEHWLVLSLIVGVGTQTVFMPFSEHLYDTEFNLAHLLKKLSYILVLIGLLNSLYQTYKDLQAEDEELLKASIYARSLIEASLDPLVTISAKGKITDVNTATEEATGYLREKLIGTDFSDYFTEPDKAREGYQHVFLNGAVTDFPLALRHRDGHVTDVLYNASVYRNEAGAVLGVFAAARDITERKRAEEALRENEHFLDSLIEHLPNMLFVKDAKDLKFVRFNKAGEDLLGYTRDELIGKNDYDFFPREQADFFISKDREIIASRQLLDIADEPISTRLLGRRYLHTRKIPVFADDGSPLYLLGISEDITERKNADEQLRRSEHGLAEAQRIAHLGNWELDLVSNVLTWSDEIYRIFEIDPEQFGASYDAFLNGIHPDDRETVNNAYTESLKSKKPYDIVHRLRMKDGRIKYVNEKCETYYAEDGKPLRSLGTVHDITEQKVAEIALTALKDDLENRVRVRTTELEAANKELEAFSYSVSHDLRTPLRAIDGFSHILLEDYADKLDDEGKRLLNVVRDNTSRMGQLIDDILKFSRAGRLELIFSEIDMESMAREVCEELRPAAGHELQVEIGHLPPAMGDRAMLRQVFVNLLSNAIKFSRARESARIEVGSSAEENETVYFVKDNGAGFDMQYVGKLFGVFQRLHSVTEFEGTGIGLAIVKRIVTRHGGRVWAEGKVNEGAAVYFTLPTGEQDHGG